MREKTVQLSTQGFLYLQIWWVPDHGGADGLIMAGGLAAGGRAAGLAAGSNSFSLRRGTVPSSYRSVGVPEHVAAAFRQYDANNSGYLDFSELRGALQRYGIHMHICTYPHIHISTYPHIRICTYE